RPRGFVGRFGGERRCRLKVCEERSIEAVEDGEMRFVSVLLAPPGASAEHLFEQNARLHLPQEDDELQIRDVDASGHEIYGDHNARLRPVAELADALQRTIDVFAASDLADE